MLCKVGAMLMLFLRGSCLMKCLRGTRIKGIIVTPHNNQKARKNQPPLLLLLHLVLRNTNHQSVCLCIDSMAAHSSFKILSLLTLLTLLSSAATTVTAISTEGVDAVLLFLRAQGHSRFANAISTSDLLFDILSLPSLTLLAPTDPNLFALDMTNTQPFYTSTLRLHALPLRLSWSQLRLLSNGSSLPTLFPSRKLLVLRRRENTTFVVDGPTVEVVMPGLYYSRDVAVHGLGGILSFRSKIGSSSATNNRNRTVFFPSIPRNRNRASSRKKRNRPVFFSRFRRIPEILPISHTIRPPPVDQTDLSAPANNAVHSTQSRTTPSNHTDGTESVLRAPENSLSPAP